MIESITGAHVIMAAALVIIAGIFFGIGAAIQYSKRKRK